MFYLNLYLYITSYYIHSINIYTIYVRRKVRYWEYTCKLGNSEQNGPTPFCKQLRKIWNDRLLKMTDV